MSRAIRVTRMGFPIMLVGLLGSVYYTADRWIAAGSLTAADAGSYGLASLVASAVFLVPTVIAQQQYPRLAMLHGKGVGAVVLIAAAHRQSLVAGGASLVVAAGVAIFSVVIVPHVLPAYESMTVPAVILAFGIVSLALATGYANLLVVVGALWWYLGLQALSVATALALMVAGAYLGGGVGLALGAAAGQAGFMLAVLVASRSVGRRAIAGG